MQISRAENNRRYVVSSVEPTNPSVGDVWIDTANSAFAYWKMDEASGDAIADYCGNCSAVASGTTVVTGIKPDGGYARQSNGTSDYIDVIGFDLSGLDAWKIEFYFIRHTDAEGYQNLLSQYKSLGWYILYKDAVGILVTVKTTDGSLSKHLTSDLTAYTVYIPTVGVKYKIEAIYTGATLVSKLYSVDEVGELTLVAQTDVLSLTGRIKPIADIGQLRMLASNADTPAEFAPFAIDDVKITAL